MRFVKSMIIVVLFLVAGGFLTVIGIMDMVEFSKPTDIEFMDADDFHSGQYVEGTIYELWDEFAYMTETNTDANITTTTGHYFAMPLEETLYGDPDDVMFIAMIVDNSSDLSTARRLQEETDDWYFYDEPISTTMKVDGKISKMDDEVYDALLDYLYDQDFNAGNIVPYELNVGGNASAAAALMFLGGILFVLGLIIGVITVLRRLHGGI